MINITKLEDKIKGTSEVKGFIFEKALELDNVYIYKKLDDETNQFYDYEVFIKKITPIYIDFDNKIFSETEFKEMYPKSSQFGLTAFSYKSYDDALLTAEKLQLRMKSKEIPDELNQYPLTPNEMFKPE